MNAIELESGRMNFMVRTSDGEFPWNPDLMELKLVCEDLEKKHELKEVDGQVQATGPFLLALASALEAAGCPNCDSTQALRVWVMVTHQAAAIINNLYRQIGE